MEADAKALDLLQQILDCPETDSMRRGRTYYNMGIALDRLGRPLDSIVSLSTALALDPSRLQALVYRSCMYEGLGDYDRAAQVPLCFLFVLSSLLLQLSLCESVICFHILAVNTCLCSGHPCCGPSLIKAHMLQDLELLQAQGQGESAKRTARIQSRKRSMHYPLNAFQVLGVSKDCTTYQVKVAFRLVPSNCICICTAV